MNNFTIPDIQRIIEVSLQEEGVLGPDAGGNLPHYFQFLYRLAQAANPALIVELGSLHGGSAMYLASGAPHARVIGIDWSDLPKPSLPNLEFWQEDTRLMSQRVRDIGIPVDILFIDSTHEAQHALEEFGLYWPLLREGGILLADDIHLADMMDFWNIVPEPKCTDDRLNSPGCGFGLAIRQ